MRVAVVGGTGGFGTALARRLVEAGETVVIGSRDAGRAREAAEPARRGGRDEQDAVRGADLVVLATKADAALEAAAALRGAIGTTPVLSVASELGSRRAASSRAPRRRRSRSVSRRCSTGRSWRACTRSPPPRSAATSRPRRTRSSAATTTRRRRSRSTLAGKVCDGRALDAGPLASARALEGMTAVIVNLNKRYKAHTGLRLTGLRR